MTTRDKAVKGKRTLSALRESLTRQEAIFAAPLIGILTLNESGSIESLNPAAERLFGWRGGAAIRCSIENLVDLGDRGDASIGARLRQLARCEDELRELTGRHRDGSVFPIDFAIAEMAPGKRLMFVVFVRDISKRKRNERLKNEFVATVSHELRTPLTSIAGSLGLLIGGAAGEFTPAAAKLLKIAYNNSQRLVRLINDILDIEKIEAGKAAFEFKRVALRPLIEQAIEANRGFADGFNVRVRFDSSLDTAIVQADADRIIQVVTNLLSNAIKYSPPASEVIVTMELCGATVRVSVRDHGPGIPEAFKSRIFGKFAQADGAKTPRKQGTGLGLNIAKQIIDHHGGTVGFGPAPGGGTIFYFDLPLATVKADEQIDDAGVLDGFRPCILHVDDDSDVLHVVAEVLRSHADIVSTHSIGEARRALAGNNIDLALIDLALADGDGLDLLSDLRKRNGAAIPAIVFSGHDAGPEVAKRVDAVLTKSRASLDRLPGILRQMASQRMLSGTADPVVAAVTNDQR